ncbi:MAG: lactonase family protein [Balneolaceae bacterium]|nr:lactonase family protein [Balneolaceae bacterium]
MIIRISFIISILIAIMGCAQQEKQGQQQSSEEFYLFVGTYTGEGSDGIYLYRFNAADGSVDSVGAALGVEDPSYLALSPDHSNLYAVNSIGDSSKATISSFSFDKVSGDLTFLNKQSSHGGGPCYISVDETGQAVFAGNYGGGSLAVFPVQDDGSLAEANTVIKHEGSSVNKARQSSPHVHCTYVSPDNNYLFVADLGTDKVYGYNFDSNNIALATEPTSVFDTEPGAGPRHITFHPNGEYAYLVNELNGSVVAFNYSDGELSPLQTISNLPENYEGRISGADLHVSPDGEFLYVTNREDLNTIVTYSIDQQSGELTRQGSVSTGGVHPRNFTIDPTGQYVLVANRHSNNIVIFDRNQDTGELTPTGREIALSQPVCLKMIPVD